MRALKNHGDTESTERVMGNSEQILVHFCVLRVSVVNPFSPLCGLFRGSLT